MADFVFNDEGEFQNPTRLWLEKAQSRLLLSPSCMLCILLKKLKKDLETVLKLESSTSKDEGWSFSSKSEFTEVWKKRCEHEMTHLIKVSPCSKPHNLYVRIFDTFYAPRAICTCLASHRMTVSESRDNIILSLVRGQVPAAYCNCIIFYLDDNKINENKNY